MSKKSFQLNYSKLFLIPEDVYTRLLQSISDKGEEDEIRKLNEMKEVESAGSFQNLTDSENEKNLEEIHHADQNTALKITGDSNSKEESPSSNETEKNYIYKFFKIVHRTWPHV